MNYIDYAIIVLYFIAMIWLGLRFKKSKAGTDYFLGGKSFGWFSLSLSTMATQLSVVSFISAPAFVGLRKGGGMQWLTFEFGVPVAMIILITFIAPALYRSGIVSVYSFLEKRFNKTSRTLLSGIFLLSRGFATSVTIYTVCLILSNILNIQFWQVMLLIGIITVLYSLEGGMKAIVYSEVAQMIIKFCGIIIIMICALHLLGGWHQFINHLDKTRLNIVDFKNYGFNGKEYGFWPMVVGGIFLYCSYYGTDQSQAQRILSAKNETTVKRILLFNGLFRFPITFAYCIGGLMLGAFVTANATFASKIPANKPDLMIPVFITNYLPHGIIGIIIIAIIAAGMSSFSASLNSLSAVTMEDFIDKHKRLPENKYVKRSKFVAFVWGILTIVLGFYVSNIAATVIEAINKIGSLFYGPIVAIFILAIMGKRINANAANIGLLTGVAINFIMWIFYKNIFWFWWNAIGGIVTLLIGTGLSLLMPVHKNNYTNNDKINHHWFTKENIILLLFFIAMVVFCIMLPRLL